MEKRGQTIGIGLVAGTSIGVVVGAITDNMGFWIAIGTAIGIVVGAVIATVRTSPAAEDSGDSRPDTLPSDTSEE